MLIEFAPRGSSSDVRAANTQRVLDVLRSHAPEWMPVRVLSEISGISRPTVTRVCDALVQAGWASVAEGVSQGVGRPAREFRFRSEHRTVAVARLEPDAVRVHLADLTGAIAAETTLTGLRIDTVADAASALLGALRTASARTPEGSDPAALVVAVPGAVSAPAEAEHPSPQTDWAEGGLLEELRAALPTSSITLSTDSRLAAEAELKRGVLRGAGSAVYLHPGRCYEPTAVLDGHVYVGAHGAACAGGNVPVLPRLEGELDFGALTALHERGDALATETLREHLSSSAFGLALLVSAFDPGTVVLGGRLHAVAELCLPPLLEEFNRMLRHPPEVLFSSITDYSAPVVGGIQAALAMLDLEHAATA